MKVYLNKWFNLNFNGTIRRAKCIDIEFEGGLGPVFIMETKFGNRFVLSRRELKFHDMSKA